MNITVTVTGNELAFIREALFNYYEKLDAQFQETEAHNLMESLPDQLKSMIMNEFDEEYAKHTAAPKKPHWTQTTKGKKIMANRKPRGKSK
jgi:hypothetical protein